MCFSTRSSLIAWVISVVIAAYLWQRNKNNDRWNATFILSFSAVQLCEAGIWYENNGKSKITHIWLGLLLLALYSQPLVQTFNAWKKTQSQFLGLMTILFLVIFVYTLYRVFTGEFYSTIGPNGHLVWNSKTKDFITGGFPIIGLLYLIGLFLGLLWILPESIPLITIGVLTFIWSMSQAPGGEFGSFWCYSAVAYSVTALLLKK